MKTAEELKQKAYKNGFFTFTETELDEYLNQVRAESLDKLMFDFFKGNGFERLAKAQMEEQSKQQEIRNNKNIREQYDYLKWRKENQMDISEQQQKEFEYCIYMVEVKPTKFNA